MQTHVTKNNIIYNKNFMLLLSAKIISETGNWIYYLAIIYFVAAITKSSADTGFVLFCNVFPSIAFAILAGNVCDRFSKRNVLVISDFISGFLSLYLGIRAAFGTATIIEVYIITTFLGISKTFFSPALNSSVPDIVNEDELNKANSLLNSIVSITNILGPVCGGILIALIGWPIAFIINGLSFIISAISELFVSIPYRSHQSSSKQKYYKQVINDALLGLKFIKSNKLIISIILAFSFMTFFVSPIVLFLSDLVRTVYNKGSIALSILMIADSVGALAAGVYLIIRPVIKLQKFFLATFPIICGIMLIVIGNIPNFYVAVIAMLIQGFYSGFGEISMITIFQKYTPENKRGMIFSLFSMIMNLLTPMSLLFSGIVLDHVRISVILSVCGLTLIIGSGFLIKSLVDSDNFNKSDI